MSGLAEAEAHHRRLCAEWEALSARLAALPIDADRSVRAALRDEKHRVGHACATAGADLARARLATR